MISNNIVRLINPFSKKSKDAIMAAGNTELCEIINVEPKLQCKACFMHWSAGIVYCTCGHLMKDDTADNKKYISFVLDLFSIPNFYIRKGPTTRSQVWESSWMQRVPYGKTNFKGNAARRNMTTSTTDSSATRPSGKRLIELGRSEEIILEMDRLASENHTHIATKSRN